MKPLTLTLAVLVCGASLAAAEPLPAERHRLVQVAPFVRYDRFSGDHHAGRAGLSARVLLGSRLGYGLGLDLDAGYGPDGAVYNAELLPAGIGLRLGEAGLLGLFAGFGVGGARGGVVPTAFQVPVELRARIQLGPVRTIGWTAVRATPFTDRRDLELEGGLALGWGRQERYWPGSSSGSGPFVAVAARSAGDEVALALTVGLELLGAN